jgi:hypothetical protein
MKALTHEGRKFAQRLWVDVPRCHARHAFLHARLVTETCGDKSAKCFAFRILAEFKVDSYLDRVVVGAAVMLIRTTWSTP